MKPPLQSRGARSFSRVIPRPVLTGYEKIGLEVRDAG
jgi:hypothetical protein